MVVWRVDNENGRGPYRGTGLGILCGFSSSNHPMPWEDIEGWCEKNNKHEYIFGFESLQSLVGWFRDELDVLDNHHVDWSITKYKVHGNCVLKGKKQVAFKATKAVRLERLPIIKTVKEMQNA